MLEAGDLVGTGADYLPQDRPQHTKLVAPSGDASFSVREAAAHSAEARETLKTMKLTLQRIPTQKPDSRLNHIQTQVWQTVLVAALVPFVSPVDSSIRDGS